MSTAPSTHGERPSLVFRLAATIVMLLAAAYFLLPVYWMVVASTKSSADLFSTPGLAFGDLNFLHNLADLSSYDGGIYWRWVGNTILYSVVGSMLTVAVCAACGYALAVFRFRGRALVLSAVLGSMLIPNTVVAGSAPLEIKFLGNNLGNTAEILVDDVPVVTRWVSGGDVRFDVDPSAMTAGTVLQVCVRLGHDHPEGHDDVRAAVAPATLPLTIT